MSKHFEIGHFESRSEPEPAPKRLFDPEPPVVDFAAMTPAQRHQFKQEVVRAARRARAAAIRSALHRLWSGLVWLAVALGEPAAAWLVARWRAAQLARTRRAAVMQLSRFTDAELKDIGLTRGDIYAAVHQRNLPRRC